MDCPHLNKYLSWCSANNESWHTCFDCKQKLFSNGDLYQLPELLHMRIKELEARNKNIYSRIEELEKIVEKLSKNNVDTKHSSQ